MRRALARQGFPSEENLHLRARGLVPQTEGRTGHFSEAVDAQVLAPPGSRRPASAHAPENVRHEVEDITEYFYLAVKSGIEDVLWRGWNAEQWSHGNAKRKRSPCASPFSSIWTQRAPPRGRFDEADGCPCRWSHKRLLRPNCSKL